MAGPTFRPPASLATSPPSSGRTCCSRTHRANAPFHGERRTRFTTAQRFSHGQVRRPPAGWFRRGTSQ
eukprot:2799722-Pyramimonas_sp.AAC.1